MFENRLPLSAEFAITKEIDTDTTLTINIESRKTKLSDNSNITINKDNVWRYILVNSECLLPGSNDEHNHSLLKTNLGPIINVRRGVALTITWKNKLVSMAKQKNAMAPLPPLANRMLEMPPINPIPMTFLNEQSQGMNPSVGVVTHLHGGKLPTAFDGWSLEPISFPRNTYGFPLERTYTYPNNQRAAMLWFHDHAMDNTAPQVHAGLAGLYFIRDKSDDDIFNLIGGSGQEIPLVIQDRIIDCDFCCVDYSAGIPYTNNFDNAGNIQSQDFERPEFLGETVFVNGRPWPHHEVNPKIYRLRVLNGSNARTYALALVDPSPWSAMKAAKQPKIWHSDLLTVIGNDGGLFPKNQTLKATDYILIAPGERLDLILDLRSICPDVTAKLRLVNLAVNSLNKGNWPEGIFQTETEIKTAYSALSVASSILQPLPVDEFDRTLLSALSIKQANIMQFCIAPHTHDNICECNDNLPAQNREFLNQLDTILLEYADGEGFQWNPLNQTLGSVPDTAVVRNRLVLLMNDTSAYAKTNTLNPLTGHLWRDTQIWEMTTAQTEGLTYSLPFDIDLKETAAPQQPTVGNPSVLSIQYTVARSTFFTSDPATPKITDSANRYADLHSPTFTPKKATYERWYVANIGNQQPLTAAIPNDPNPPAVPDMHPFHMHLVNFVVLRRFVLNSYTNAFEPITRNNTYDTQIRHDTVCIQSNELLELLVYFPPDYTGNYPYHCHLVEHEDMGMMLHFEGKCSDPSHL